MVAWSDPGYEAVVREVRQRAGLIFAPGRRAAVENTIHRVMARAGATDITRFAARLRSDVELRNALIGELTVGESYFFRDPAQFALIEREIVPDLLTRREPGARLRVWSAGCASGEEPYSIAILFQRMGLADRARITGTEISIPRLEAARRARYGRWALRGVPPELVDSCFEQHGHHYDLAHHLRDAVEFRRLNLAKDIYPAPAEGLADFDLILCRNVLIYLDTETIRAVATRLLASLAEDGWLLFSASDPPIHELVPCTALLTPHGIAYRRIEQLPPDRVDARGWRAIVGASRRDAVPRAKPDAAPRETMPRDPPVGVRVDPGPRAAPGAWPPRPGPDAEPPHPTEAGWVHRVRELADQGRLEEAGRVCAAALDKHRLSAELTLLHAVLLIKAGRHSEAVATTGRALYLEPGSVMAYVLRGQAFLRIHERTSALRAFENARLLLARMDADAAVPASDGLRAGHLFDRVLALIRLLRETE